MIKGLFLFGQRASGKDTVVELLKQRIDNSEQLRLAGFVVTACNAFGIDNPTKTDLVKVGQDIGRKYFGDDVWINQGISKIKNNPGITYIVSDVRYQNEYDKLVELGFIPILITCDLETCKQRAIKRDGSIDEKLLTHNTETTWKTFEYDYCIENNGTLEELENKVDELITSLQSN